MKEKVLLILILLLAIFFRLNNRNWDDNHHIHPDERFLTMVGTDMKIPLSFSDYLDPSVSTLNPANINYKFFVYGVFPLVLNKLIALEFGNDNYDGFTLQGRLLSGIFDLFIVFLIYKTAKLLFSKKVSGFGFRTSNLPLWSAFFYAVAVLPIQLSHFFAVDTFLNFLMFASFYFILKFYYSSGEDAPVGEEVSRSPRNLRTLIWLILSAVFFGLACASKITALFILPLNLFFLLSAMIKGHSGKRPSSSEGARPESKSDSEVWVNFILLTIIYLLLSYFTLRLTDPYMFQQHNFFDPRPSKIFIENLRELKNLTKIDPSNFFPPMIQWMNKNTLIHSLINNVVFGLGVPISILVLVGMGWLISKPQLKIKNINIIIILLWTLGLFIYQSFQTTPTLRYFIIIYPFLAVFAGIGLSVVSSQLSVINNKLKINKFILLTTEYLLLITVVLIWPAMFTSIYRNKLSRVVASEWIYKNFKNESVIVNEHWDDGLPFPISTNYNKQFTSLELPVFGPDDESKWKQMDEKLQQADYYILSSNRAWGSILSVPKKYPKMSKFYKDLFAQRCISKLNSESVCFQKVAEFTSYPRLEIGNWKLEFPDDWADEGFTVYDHPKVLIFKKVKQT